MLSPQLPSRHDNQLVAWESDSWTLGVLWGSGVVGEFVCDDWLTGYKSTCPISKSPPPTTCPAFLPATHPPHGHHTHTHTEFVIPLQTQRRPRGVVIGTTIWEVHQNALQDCCHHHHHHHHSFQWLIFIVTVLLLFFMIIYDLIQIIVCCYCC